MVICLNSAPHPKEKNKFLVLGPCFLLTVLRRRVIANIQPSFVLTDAAFSKSRCANAPPSARADQPIPIASALIHLDRHAGCRRHSSSTPTYGRPSLTKASDAPEARCDAHQHCRHQTCERASAGMRSCERESGRSRSQSTGITRAARRAWPGPNALSLSRVEQPISIAMH